MRMDHEIDIGTESVTLEVNPDLAGRENVAFILTLHIRDDYVIFGQGIVISAAGCDRYAIALNSGTHISPCSDYQLMINEFSA